MPTTPALPTTMATPAATDKIIFAFETAYNVAWQTVNDDVMGGVSTSDFRLTNRVAVFQGEVSLLNNGGFASVRARPADPALTGCAGFVIRVRGDGRRYKFTVRMEHNFDSVIYQAGFATKNGLWAEHRLPQKEFVPTFRGRVLSGEPPFSSAEVRSVGFLISDRQAGPFRLEIAWIKATTISER